MRSRNSLWVVLAAAVIVIAAVCLLILRMQPQALGDDDLAGLVRSKDIGLPAEPENEFFEKTRTFDGSIKVHYRAFGLGERQRSTVDEITMVYPDSVHAALGFQGMKIGGNGGFAVAAAGKNESMVAREVHFGWADHTYWADYRVGDNIVGVCVIVQTGSIVHFISLNGMLVNETAFEPILRSHWKPVS